MNFLDLSILIFVAFFIIRGVFRGLVGELTAIVGLIFGYIFAMTYLPVCVQMLLYLFPTLSEYLLNVICLVILFVGFNIAIRIVAKIVTKTLKFAMLSWLNYLFGALAGLLKATVILSALVLLINLIPFSDAYLNQIGKQESVLYPVFDYLGPQLYSYIKSMV